MLFFSKGATHSRRAFIAGNRVGKSMAGAYELVCHMTGIYPHWWEGKKFTKPVNAWVAGLTGAQLRESIQEILFGNFADKGTGLFPRESLLDEKGEIMTWAMPGTPNCVGTCLVNHVSGGKSKVEFKSCEQGWEKFQGAKRDVIWLDEEPSDHKIYEECATRTAGDTGKEGILYCTFTPLQGFSDTVLGFLPNGIMPDEGQHPTQKSKFVVSAGWKHVPHLSEDWKEQQLLEYGPNQRKARSEGIPSMGTGRIYPVEEEDVVVRAFAIPDYWPRCYGLDFGWHATAAIWLAQDPSTKCIYAYAEYKRGEQATYVHANAVKARGDWIVGAADPSGGGRNSNDGTLLIEEYRNQGLKLVDGINAKASGIARILNALESGSLKFFHTLEKLIKEYRIYHYDLNNPNEPARGQEDHLLDCLKYAMSRFDEIATSEIDNFYPDDDESFSSRIDDSRDSLTGY